MPDEIGVLNLPTRDRNKSAPKLTAKEKKERFIALFAEGVSVEQAARNIGCSPKTHDYYMGSDQNYRDRVLAIRATQGRREAGGKTVPDFVTFRREYLGRDTFWHQLQWVDVLEGNEPRDLHPAEIWNPGDPSWIILNTPPEHSKSTTITVDYVIWKLCQDPNFRVVIVSKTLPFARKFMYQIQTILTHHRYSKLQADFAPPGGFKADSDSWSSDKIYFGQGMRDSGEKDPTVQVLGMGQQIYGARADLIILDDCIVLSNAHEFEKQIDWITQEVLTRPSSRGVILVVGTRVAAQDVYSELRNASRYEDGESPWTYFAQPAVLSYDDDPEKWVTLWPRTDQPCGCRAICHRNMEPDEDGLYPKWDGLHLRRRRSAIPSRATWARVYMQFDVADDQTFKPELVNRSVEGRRQPGPLIAGAMGHPEHGGEGHYRIGSLDPAMAGHSAAIVYSVDRKTHKRYIVDVHDEPAMTPLGIRTLIKTWTMRYGLHEWRIEGNAFQNYLAQDQELKDWLASRGCVLNPHITGRNKWDPDYGVSSMAPLFGDMVNGEITRAPLIELPSPKQHEAVRRLIEQLIVWQPAEVRGKHVKTDIVMALWFAELRAREILQTTTYQGTHLPSRNVTGYQKRQQYSVNLDDAWQQQNSGVIYADDLHEVPDPTYSLPTPWQPV